MPEWFGGSTLNSTLFLPLQDQWLPQWNRVQRWREKAQTLRRKAEHTELDAFDRDDVIAYLQNLHHLRDWIESSRPVLKPAIESLFKAHFELGACRDVCNGFKHKALTRPSHDADFNMYRVYDYLVAISDPSRSPVIWRWAFAEGNNVREFDLFELPETCFQLWEAFIAREIGKDSGNGVPRGQDS